MPIAMYGINGQQVGLSHRTKIFDMINFATVVFANPEKCIMWAVWGYVEVYRVSMSSMSMSVSFR